MYSVSTIVVAGIVMLAAMTVCARVAPRVGLLDSPDGVRKLHDGQIPLTGGPALLLVLSVIIATSGSIAVAEHQVLLGIALITVLVGMLDDRFELSASGRLLVQLALAAGVVFAGGVSVTHLGDLAGTGSQLPLAWLAPWITIGALAAAMNAFNMLDGIDGQASGLALVGAGAIAVAAGLAGTPIPLIAIVLLGALPVFLVFNFGAPGGLLPKSFLGDSGALLLGLLVGWLLVSTAQQPDGWLRPVTVLWFAAVPLFDTLFVMSYRMMKRRSPLTPDRNHIHHLLTDFGLSKQLVLVTVLGVAAALAATGLALEAMQVPEVLAFLGLFALFLTHLRIAFGLQRLRERQHVQETPALSHSS